MGSRRTYRKFLSQGSVPCSDTAWVALVGWCRIVKAVSDEFSNAEDNHIVPVALTTDRSTQ